MKHASSSQPLRSQTRALLGDPRQGVSVRSAPLTVRAEPKLQATTFSQPDGKVKTFKLKAKDGGYALGYRHCLYILPMPITASERSQLATFILNQDRIRQATSPLLNGFPTYLARILKHSARSDGYAEGYRWRYTAGRGSSFRSRDFATLEQLLQALAAL